MCGVAEATLALAAISTAQSVVAAGQQAAAQAELSNYQAAVRRTEASLREDDTRTRARRLIGSQLATASGSGVDSGFGTPPLVAQTTAGDAERQIFNDHLAAELGANADQISAANARQAGRNKQVSSVLDFAVRTAESGVVGTGTQRKGGVAHRHPGQGGF